MTPDTYRPTYELTETDVNRIDTNFAFHPVKGDQANRYAVNREGASGLALLFCMNCPPSRERSVALAKIEEAMFWANAAIARNE